jgi:hypothetical protein
LRSKNEANFAAAQMHLTAREYGTAGKRRRELFPDQQMLAVIGFGQRPAREENEGKIALGELVDLKGFEPLTSSMPWKRAPNCATGPRGMIFFDHITGALFFRRTNATAYASYN